MTNFVDHAKEIVDAMELKYPEETSLSLFQYLEGDVRDAKRALVGDHDPKDPHFNLGEQLGGVIANSLRILRKEGENLDEVLEKTLRFYADLNLKSTSEKQSLSEPSQEI